MHLLLLDLCILLNLLAIKHIFIRIRRLTKTSITTLATLLLLNPITSHCKALILFALQRVGLMACLQGIGRLLAAQEMLISGLTPHSVGALRLRSVHKSKLTRRIVVYLCIPRTTCSLSLQTEPNCLVILNQTKLIMRLLINILLNQTYLSFTNTSLILLTHFTAQTLIGHCTWLSRWFIAVDLYHTAIFQE